MSHGKGNMADFGDKILTTFAGLVKAVKEREEGKQEDSNRVETTLSTLFPTISGQSKEKRKLYSSSDSSTSKRSKFGKTNWARHAPQKQKRGSELIKEVFLLPDPSISKVPRRFALLIVWFYMINPSAINIQNRLFR